MVCMFSFSVYCLALCSPRMIICEYDPQVSDFYVMRRVLEKETKGVEHSGIETAVKRKLVQMVSTRSRHSLSSIPISSDSTDQQTNQMPRKSLRRSADCDMSISLSTFTNTNSQ